MLVIIFSYKFPGTTSQKLRNSFTVVHLFSARIRRMGEGTVFSLFVSSHLDGGGRGYPIPGLDRGGLPHPRSGPGGVPHPRSGLGEYLIPGLDWGGVTPSQVWTGGVPHTPSQVGGYPRYPPPQPGLDGVPPHPH